MTEALQKHQIREAAIFRLRGFVPEASRVLLPGHQYILPDGDYHPTLGCSGRNPFMPTVNNDELQIEAACRNCAGLFVYLIKYGRWVDERLYQQILAGKIDMPEV